MLKLLRRFEAWMLDGRYLSRLDVLARARQLLIFYLLLIAEVLTLLNIPEQIVHEHHLQLFRSLLFIVVLAIVYMILVRTRDVARISYFLLFASTSNVLINTYLIMGEVNLSMVQLAIANTLFAFFMAGQVVGVLTALANYVPLLVYRIFKLENYFGQYFRYEPPSEQEIIISLVMMTFMMVFIIWHFQRAFRRYAIELQNSLEIQENLNVALEDARLEAEASSRAKSNFLSVMSHEIRTPMNGIIGITELLHEQTRDTKQKEYLDLLKFSADNLLGMLNNVLDYNRLESGKMELERLAFNPEHLLKNIVAGFQPMADEKRISLRYQCEGIPDKLWGDPTKLAQILINLIGNAVKFTSEGEVLVSMQSKGKDLYNISIQDTGVGIAADKQSLIFEHFAQASADVSRKYGGSGLGLAIVKKILGLMQTDIRLESTPGVGSTFSFDIIFETVTENQGLIRKMELSESLIQGVKVLVVEDNPINATVITGLLKRWKMPYHWVSGGKEALQAVEDEKFDIILMDLHMPDMDGFETMRRIRKQGYQTPILAITADVQEETFLKARKAGANDCIVKPYNAAELHSIMEQCLQLA